MLVGALAEGEIHVPRLGRVPAAAGFRLIAAMNPFDAVGTARVSQAIADRMCRIAIGYQDAPGEREIVDAARRRRARSPRPRSSSPASPARTRRSAWARRCAGRSTSSGSAPARRPARRAPSPQPGEETFADAAVAALSGRLRLEEGCERTPEEIVLELIERLEPAGAGGARAAGKSRRPAPGGAGRSLSGAAGARRRPRARPPDDQPRPARTPPRAADRSRRRSAGSTSRPSTTCCAATPTPPSRCSPTSPRPPTRSCAPRRASSPRGCSCAPAGSARHPPRLPPADARPGRGRGRPRPRPDL